MPIKLEDWLAAVESQLKKARFVFCHSPEGFPIVEPPAIEKRQDELLALRYSVPVKLAAEDGCLLLLPACQVLVQLKGVMARSIS